MLPVLLAYALAADDCGCSGLYFWSSGSGKCKLFGGLTSSDEATCCKRGGCPVDKGAEESCRLCGAMHDLSSCTSCTSSSLCLPGYGGPNCDKWVGRTDAPDTPSPPTPAPDTPAPDTPAPKTPAPDTTAPDTLAPDTPAPPTPAPDTPFPDTPAPKTPAPDTPFPDTPAPKTPAPDTPFPDTPAPETPAPDTPFPDTPAPSTPAPKTPSPDTNPPDTPAPPTPAPPTPAPDTAIPGTFAPHTPVPATTAPATFSPETGAPDTPAPDTSAPPTLAPLTPAPDTPRPASSAPSTRVPDTALPSLPATFEPTPSPPDPPSALPVVEPIVDREVIDVLGSLGTLGGALGGGGAASAGVLVMVSGGCNLNGNKKLSWLLHPTQMELFGSEDAGVVVGNTAIMVGFAFVCYLVLRTVHAVGRKNNNQILFATMDTQGLLRLPSSPLLVFQVFFLGTCYGATGLIVGPPSALGFILGLVSGAGCVVVPVLMFRVTRQSVPADALYVANDARGSVEQFFLGEGEWVSRHPERHWVQRYSSVMRTYRQEVAWFWFLEAMAAIALSGIYSIHPENYTGCGHVSVFSSVIFIVLMVLEGALWPHARPRDSVFGFVSNGLQGAATLLMGIGYYAGDIKHKAFDIAELVLVAGFITVVAKTAFDISSELYVFFTGQRLMVQEDYWGERMMVLATGTDIGWYPPATEDPTEIFESTQLSDVSSPFSRTDKSYLCNTVKI